MTRNIFVPLILLNALCGALSAQSFSFFSTLRAGFPNGGGYQIGVGPTSSADAARENFQWNSTSQTWRVDGAQAFEIGWEQATNRAYVNVLNEGGTLIEASIANNGPQLSSQALWTLPDASFILAAVQTSLFDPIFASSISIEDLELSPNTSLVSGTLPSSLQASRPLFGATDTENLPATIVINPASNGGDWYLRGNIRFAGAFGQGGLARGSQLAFNLQATGSEAPDGPTFGLIGSGLVFFALRRRTLGRSFSALRG